MGLSRQQVKKIGMNIAVLFVTFLLMIVVLEVMIRIIYPQNLNTSALDEDKKFVLKPNIESSLTRQEFSTHVSINSHGMRDVEYSFEKPPGTFRIAAVGDSFTFGFGVEVDESYPKLLEKKLNAQNTYAEHSSYEVLNFGVPAYGTDQMYLSLDEIFAFSPDLILLSVGGNDIKENQYYGLLTIENGELIHHPIEVSTLLRLRNVVSWHSHLYSLFYFTVIDKFNDPAPTAARPKTDFDALMYSNEESEVYTQAVDHTLFVLNEIIAQAQQRDIPIVVLYVPYREQIDANKRAAFVERKGIDPSLVNATKLNALFSGGIDDPDLMFIDPTPLFVQNNQDNTFFYNIDGHWRPIGHELVAQEVHEELVWASLLS